jgi:hypothetical protein
VLAGVGDKYRRLKTEGMAVDAFVADPDVNSYPPEALTVPILIVHAEDDPLVAHDAAHHAAGRVRGARLVSMERGGNLLLGDREDVGREVTTFIAPYLLLPPLLCRGGGQGRRSGRPGCALMATGKKLSIRSETTRASSAASGIPAGAPI